MWSRNDADTRRGMCPKKNPSVTDMLATLRRVLIAAEFLPQCPDQPTCEEIAAVHLAWAQAAA
jgi:hypothetical protein